MGIAALVIVAPLAATVVVLLLRRRAVAIALAGIIVGCIAALITLARVADGARFRAELPGLPDWPLRLTVDPTGALISTVVAVVSTFVMVYAVGYMAGEAGRVRFFAEMAFFVGAMQLLVLAGDWILFLAAWELIGLASYLLIGFWFDRPGVGVAATRAFLVTRAADFGLYLGAILLIRETGTSAIGASAEVTGAVATVAGLAFLLAAIGKSAQAPLQGWLMDAMVGPTPVSALLHAATLVIAGVVLLVRAFPLLPSNLLLVIGLIGGVSSVLTGLIAVAQRDLKRLLAASTSSQLGLMLLALGAGSVPAALAHLVAHAAMKSALFLGAGIFQHDRHTTAFADLRGIGRQRRATFAAMVVAGIALAGVPPLAGFWSKDAVIAATSHSSHAIVLAPLAAIASLLTGVYIARAIRLLWNDSNAEADPEPGRATGTVWMGFGLGALTVLAATLGLAIGPIGELLGAGIPESAVSVIVGLAMVVFGLLTGWLVPVRRLFGVMYFDILDGFRIRGGGAALVVRPALALAHWCNRVDRDVHAGVLTLGHLALDAAAASCGMDEGLHWGVEGVGRLAVRFAHASRSLDQDGIDGLIGQIVRDTRRAGSQARRLQTGLVYRELLLAVGGAVVLLVLVLIV